MTHLSIVSWLPLMTPSIVRTIVGVSRAMKLVGYSSSDTHIKEQQRHTVAIFRASLHLGRCTSHRGYRCCHSFPRHEWKRWLAEAHCGGTFPWERREAMTWNPQYNSGWTRLPRRRRALDGGRRFLKILGVT